MPHNLSIAVIGSVSVGKSTFINAFYAENLSECKRVRSTMVPQIYIETPDIKIFDTNKIKKINDTDNKNNHDTLVLNEIIHNVPISKHQLDKNNRNDFLLHIYDIPGLDDAKTKDLYFKWVSDNFNKFDIIIYILDIERGFNTDGEISILNLLCSLSHKWQESHNKTTIIIPLANKCDDVEMNGKEFNFNDDELLDMYKSIETTLESKRKEYNLHDKIKCLLPISSEDIYIYRCIQEKGISIIDNIEKKYFNKIGINEFGKRKWNKVVDQKGEIKKYFTENDITSIINKTTTYGRFMMIFNSIIKKHRNDFYINPYNINKLIFDNQHIEKYIRDISIRLDKYYKLQLININPPINTLLSSTYDVLQKYINDKGTSVDKLLTCKVIIDILNNNKHLKIDKIVEYINNELQLIINIINVNEFGILIREWNIDNIIKNLLDNNIIIDSLINFSIGNHDNNTIDIFYNIICQENKIFFKKLKLNAEQKLKIFDSFLKCMLKFRFIKDTPLYFINYIEIYIDDTLPFIKRAYFSNLIGKLKIKYHTNDLYNYPDQDIFKNKIEYFFK
jgi:hypothetical protein